ncbi:FAD-dependent monooxygenase [Mycobacterium sp. NBC_00419]|uniref:FAD-dependent monooxygenase n=1 Tax=Mycobacterium sp. NBC_00419 TaxID=2975989 RepID=UPI002E2331A5
MDILISGASIAGPTVAYWLAKAGHRVTVIERADSLRTAGQNIDVRGSGREVLRRMNLEAAVAAQTTGEVGLRFVDEDSILAEFPAGRGDSAGATAEIEILRGALARTLVDAGVGEVSYVYGDQIERIEQDADSVAATTAGGRTYSGDLLIVAEGARSRTRSLVFDDVVLRELGLYTAFGTIPRDRTDDSWWTWYNAVGGRAITVRPDNVGTTRVALSFLSENAGLQDLDGAGQRRAVAAAFADVGWKAPRIVAALAGSDEFYLDYLTQVLAPRWARGRVILCGDAAWCATPVSGVGTTLALTGAYILAGEIACAASPAAAVAGYERRMRPLVDRAQKLPPGTPRLAHPRSRAGLALTRRVLRLAGSRPARALAERFTAPATRADELPHYPVSAS